jgi:hypothetical protein
LLADVRSKAGDKLNGTIDKIAGSLASLRVPTYGTLHEIVVARQQRKPVLLVWPPDGMKSCSAWLAWLVGHKNVFSSMDECVAKLDGIMRGTESLEDDEDWLVFALVNRCHHQGGGS